MYSFFYLVIKRFSLQCSNFANISNKRASRNPEKSQITEDLKLLLLSFLRKTREKESEKIIKAHSWIWKNEIVEIMSFVLKENILSAR